MGCSIAGLIMMALSGLSGLLKSEDCKNFLNEQMRNGNIKFAAYALKGTDVSKNINKKISEADEFINYKDEDGGWKKK